MGGLWRRAKQARWRGESRRLDLFVAAGISKCEGRPEPMRSSDVVIWVSMRMALGVGPGWRCCSVGGLVGRVFFLAESEVAGNHGTHAGFGDLAGAGSSGAEPRAGALRTRRQRLALTVVPMRMTCMDGGGPGASASRQHIVEGLACGGILREYLAEVEAETDVASDICPRSACTSRVPGRRSRDRGHHATVVGDGQLPDCWLVSVASS